MRENKLIYAVDDELSIRELYSCALENAGFDCKCFENADGLFRALEKEKCDLILLDIMLDGMDGYEILAKLSGDIRFAAIPVIMVSAKGNEIDKVRGLNLGAADYMSKPFGVLELAARIKANLRKSDITAKTSFKGIFIDDAKHEITVGGKRVDFTLKEYNLLKLLIENVDKALKRDEILNAVWGEEYFGETRTLDIHIAELRKKISDSNAEIITVRGVGYKLI